MPFVKVYIHFVWATKNRFPFLETPSLRQEIWYHILDNARKKSIFADTVNGYQEHCHALISLSPQHSLSNVMQLIKGESSYWINKNKLCKFKFGWQDEFFAVSVSPSDLDSVREYIRSQEIRHQKVSFEQEIETDLKAWGFELVKDASVKRRVQG